MSTTEGAVRDRAAPSLEARSGLPADLALVDRVAMRIGLALVIGAERRAARRRTRPEARSASAQASAVRDRMLLARIGSGPFGPF